MFGLFKGKSKEVENIPVSTKASFDKTTLTTSNVAAELEGLAQKHGISSKKLDFKILSYKTMAKVAYGDIYQEVTELNKQEIFTHANFLNPNMQVSQEYKIEVFLKSSTSKFPIAMSIGGNKALTRIQARIKAQENVQYFDGLESEILSELDKKKVRNGFILGCLDAGLKSGVHKLISDIRVNGCISQDTTFDICRGYDVENGGGGGVVYHYRKEHDDTNEKMAMQGVKVGEIVIEVKKDVQPQKGRDCKGKLIENAQIELSDSQTTITVSEDFDVVETKESIQYIAKRDGFVSRDDGKFTIKDEYVIDAMSLKSTGSIDVGQDKNIKIMVKEHDRISDAIGAGMKINTSEICVQGNVANGAEIVAEKAEIQGQTHQSASIIAKDVKIFLHKGYAEGDVVEIDTLEGGKVVGDIVRVNKLFGGEIEAKEVYIQKVLSNAKVSASHHIEMESIEGTGNMFIIEASAQRGYHEKHETLETSLKSLVLDVNKMAKELKKVRDKIQQEQETILSINSKVRELKAAGVKPPAGLILKLKDHQERIKDHNSLLKELKDAKIEKTSIQETLTALNSSVYDAKVITKSPWKEFNEVQYKLYDPKITASFLAQEGVVAKVLTLSADAEGGFHIQQG